MAAGIPAPGVPSPGVANSKTVGLARIRAGCGVLLATVRGPVAVAIADCVGGNVMTWLGAGFVAGDGDSPATGVAVSSEAGVLLSCGSAGGFVGDGEGVGLALLTEDSFTSIRCAVVLLAFVPLTLNSTR